MKKLTKEQKLNAIRKSLIRWGKMEEENYGYSDFSSCELCKACGVGGWFDVDRGRCKSCPVWAINPCYTSLPCGEWTEEDLGLNIVTLCFLKAMVETGDI